MLNDQQSTLAAVLTEGGPDRREVSRALAKAGAHVLFVDPTSKAPLDLRSDVQRRKEDAAERARTGNPNATAPTGLHLATDDPILIGRYWARAEKNNIVPNIAVRLGRSGLIAVDADTAEQVAGVQRLASPDDPTAYPLTNSSPGSKNAAGKWVHRDGGHFVFVVDYDMPGFGKFDLPGGAVVMGGDSYVLVPPSARPEGAYRNVGPVRALSDPSSKWLVQAMLEHFEQHGVARKAREERAAARAERREAGEDDLSESIVEWSDRHSWEELLTADGWEPNCTGKNGRPLRKQRMDSCGCPTFTAPGDHDNGKSATAHEDGCSTERVELEGLSGPLHFWTPNLPDQIKAGMERRGDTARCTKAWYMADVHHGGDMGAFLRAAGIAAAPWTPLPIDAFAIPAPPETSPHDPALTDAVFGFSPVTAHILEQARQRVLGPWSALAVALVQATVLTPWQVRLPAIVGSEASTNQLVAVVGPSGAGKGVSTTSDTTPILSWAPDPLNEHPALVDTGQSADEALTPRSPGSGEAIATLYRDWRTLESTDDKGKVTRTLTLLTVARTAWMDFPEVDQVASLMRRESSTLSPELRKVWDGRHLGVHTKSKERRSEVAAFSYRAAVTIGVQPERAEALLSGEDGGLPQRIVWAATNDPHAPEDDDAEPVYRSLEIAPPPWRLDGDRPVTMPVAAPIRAEIRRARRRVVRGDEGALTGIDSHRNLVRLKLAAAVAVLHSRAEVTEADWHLAGLVLDHSDRVRADMQRTLNAARTAAHEARGAADTAREHGARRTRDDEIEKAAAGVHQWLANRKGRSFTTAQIRSASKTHSARHTWCAEAIAALVDEGSIGHAADSRTGTAAYTWTADREGQS